MSKTALKRPSTLTLAGAAALSVSLGAMVEAAHAGQAEAEAIVAKYRTLPVFTPPGEPFDAKACMQGKKVLTLPISSTIPFNSGITNSLDAIAAEVGFEHRTWQNQGQPTQWIQGIEFAIQNDYDAITMTAGLSPEMISAQVQAARDAGIKIYAAHHADITTPKVELADIELPLSFTRVGEILAAWVVNEIGEGANVLVVGADDVKPSQPYWKAFEAELKRLSPAAQATYVNVNVADWATKIQTSTQGALMQDPSINYIVPIYDSMAQFVLPALAITGRKGDIPIATFNGTPFSIDMIQNGDVAMNIGESLGWIARSSMDAYMRDLCGLPVTQTELYVPFYIFDKDNAASAGTPAGYDTGYGDAHIAGYQKLWGLQ